MRRNIHYWIILLLYFFPFGCSEVERIQERVLAPYKVDAKLGGSVKKILHAHPKHQSAGDGLYLYRVSAPDLELRTIRIRGKVDKILWIQIQDDPIGITSLEEQHHFETEMERLEGILGPAARKGDRLSTTRTAVWSLGNNEIVELALIQSDTPAVFRRTLSLGQSPD